MGNSTSGMQSQEKTKGSKPPEKRPSAKEGRDQGLIDSADQKSQENKLRQAKQIDKGPSACNPEGRR